MKIKFIIILSLLIITGCSQNKNPESKPASNNPENISKKDIPLNQTEPVKQTEQFDFSSLDEQFSFSAELPEGFEVEYIESIRSLNIYDPQAVAGSIRDKSQIFIRFFEANDFLTLSTVSILNQEKISSSGRPAVRYEIVKKEGVANFPEQPLWRNEKHKLIDIRYSDQNPTTFFVFSYNPTFLVRDFENFIDSIRFYNDRESYTAPLNNFAERISKKPFGIYVTPQNSPIQPEQFTGYHTAVDLEIFNDELNKNIEVKTICGGRLKAAQNASGYGGVIMQECLLDSTPVTVIYGHLDIRTSLASVGTYLSPGTTLASLADDQSTESGGERKHLHLGMYTGEGLNLRSYVDTRDELSSWIDPEELID